MASCHDMKKGQIYVCSECGLELQVVAECAECGADEATCSCEVDCSLECCDQPLTLKK